MEKNIIKTPFFSGCGRNFELVLIFPYGSLDHCHWQHFNLNEDENLQTSQQFSSLFFKPSESNLSSNKYCDKGVLQSLMFNHSKATFQPYVIAEIHKDYPKKANCWRFIGTTTRIIWKYFNLLGWLLVCLHLYVDSLFSGNHHK